MIKKEYYKTITRENSALVLIDHQIGLYSGVRAIPVDELKHNLIGLVKAAKIFRIPIIVTTTTESMWGPMIPELQELLVGIPVIERTTVNAWGGELSNKLSKARFFANNQEFKQGTKEEQEIATACMVLIQNAILL